MFLTAEIAGYRTFKHQTHFQATTGSRFQTSSLYRDKLCVKPKSAATILLAETIAAERNGASPWSHTYPGPDRTPPWC